MWRPHSPRMGALLLLQDETEHVTLHRNFMGLNIITLATIRYVSGVLPQLNNIFHVVGSKLFIRYVVVRRRVQSPEQKIPSPLSHKK